jgi:hypothetical protein
MSHVLVLPMPGIFSVSLLFSVHESPVIGTEYRCYFSARLPRYPAKSVALMNVSPTTIP